MKLNKKSKHVCSLIFKEIKQIIPNSLVHFQSTVDDEGIVLVWVFDVAEKLVGTVEDIVFDLDYEHRENLNIHFVPHIKTKETTKQYYPEYIKR